MFGKHLLYFAPEFINGLILAVALDALFNSNSKCMLRRSQWWYRMNVQCTVHSDVLRCGYTIGAIVNTVCSIHDDISVGISDDAIVKDKL